MTNLTENEMAAIAAGLWEPGQTRFSKATGKTVMLTAPDMRDPANLWRALEYLNQRGWAVAFDAPFQLLSLLAFKPNREIKFDGLPPTRQMFAALVTLYKAEHPNG